MTEFDIEECRRRCELTMKNTASGKWLGAALDRLELIPTPRARKLFV